MKKQFLKRRFAELVEQLDAVEATKRYEHDAYIKGDFIDGDLFLSWCVKARNLISMACGSESEHYRCFVDAEDISALSTNYSRLKQTKAVFLAAKEDFDGGYVSTLANLVRAEVFGDELEQAAELLRSGYKSAAAVVAGVVLETTLRQLCANAGITTGKLDKMNADLAKAGTYNLLVQKRITALADIRNNAAHGHPDEFKEADVTEMISQIEAFIADHL